MIQANLNKRDIRELNLHLPIHPGGFPTILLCPDLVASYLNRKKPLAACSGFSFGIICVLILCAVLIARYLTTLAGPVVTADNYYQAVSQKNYTLAYSYLTSNATLISQNQKVPIGPQQDYVTYARLLDSHIGPVTNYTVATANDTTLLIINTTRVKNARPIHYSVRFTMIQVDGTWKIKDMDGAF